MVKGKWNLNLWSKNIMAYDNEGARNLPSKESVANFADLDPPGSKFICRSRMRSWHKVAIKRK